MLTLPEIVNSTRGTLRLLHFDPAGAAYFDNSHVAFWRSFRVMALIAPVYVLVRVIDYGDLSFAASEFDVLVVEALRYVVQWFLYPVVLYEVTRWFDLQGNYLRYITALNWINVPLIGIALVVVTICDLLPLFRVGFAIGLQLLSFIWFYSTTRLVLRASWPLTFGLFAFDMIASLLLDGFVQRTLGIARL